MYWDHKAKWPLWTFCSLVLCDENPPNETEGSHTVTILHVEKHLWYAVNDSDLPKNCHA